MSSYEDEDSNIDETQSQEATSSIEDSDPYETQIEAPMRSQENSDEDEDDIQRLTLDEKKATTKGKDPKPFTSLIKYPTLLTKPIPILIHHIFICKPDWDSKSSIIHNSLISINALQASCADLHSTLSSQLQFLNSLPATEIEEQITEKAKIETPTPLTFATNLDSVLSKVTLANDKLLDMETKLRWKKVFVVNSLCRKCDQEYRDDWTELHDNWDHPPYWEKRCFGNGWLKEEENLLEGLGLD
ncbi:MAG: hypothetical protein LQ337_006023 [Flavoplaca oasis]|nr:MAG: hypothetical protein LQ337_006023 [Flavoplaca oasis]